MHPVCRWRRVGEETRSRICITGRSLFLFGLDFEYSTPFMVRQHTKPTDSEIVNVVIENNVLHTNLNDIESIHIFSITGQLLLSQNANIINLQSLPAGMYSVVININHNHITKKIIKQ